MPFTYNDGGRSAAGYRGEARDCAVRAIAIAAELPYQRVYKALAHIQKQQEPAGHAAPRQGVQRRAYDAYLQGLGWQWTPTMQVGSGCQVHLRPEELPAGRLIVRLSRHLAAVIDGTVQDTYDPTRGGTRCVYGYWSKP